ncbi:phosphatidylinositol polyphosphate 5-phosphatase type IV-like [Mercenaria mercenaria]|uniref:phosphatidylinositol polyphosphate 5-phosphatase type IV-like n=1 Tax=Mercenaria mercenaria TaxID=6596 RepID=UPI00234F2F87|nr:phosphatidylinositol polyphosphate 5-phosphatase type IV-like [Mercenaria mercenaria]
MDIEHETIHNTGSIVSLTHKPPHKGRKKKSAVAKLAEKKRLGSECGSEYGSVVSLQKDETEKTDSKDNSDQKVQQNVKNSLTDIGKDNTVNDTDKVAALNEKNRNNSNVKSAGKSDNLLEEFANKEKNTPPKPVPRKLNRKKLEDNNIGLEGGTVVSIYDKREQTPPRKAKHESSPATRNNVDKEKSKLKKELFPKSTETEKSDGTFSLLGPGKPRSGLTPLGDLPPLDCGPQKIENVQLSPPLPMDLDHDSDHEENENKHKDDLSISNNAPSDATVHRFRAMRMTPDRSRSEESLKNAQFAPKPPSTPRSARKTPPKGEKRNRESNSSGEEADMEKKKQNSDSAKISENILNTSLSNLQTIESDKMDIDIGMDFAHEPVRKGLSIHPNVKEVKDFDDHSNINQNMNDDSPEVEQIRETSDVTEAFQVHDTSIAGTDNKDKSESPHDNVPYEKERNGGKKSGKKRIIRKPRVSPSTDRKVLAPLDGSDVQSPGKGSIDTIGSASDLKAISEQYQEVLKNDSPRSVHSEKESVIPEPKLNSGKLSPIQPKSLPPPLPHDMKSTSLRTTYKTDPKYSMSKFFGRSFSGSNAQDKTKFETMSHRSLSATTTIHAVPTREARDRMKHGTLGSTLLSSSELDKYFPDRKVGLWVGCWNMAEIKDCREPLDDFLLPEVSEYVQDIYAIGTQENAMNKKEWEILLQETIGPSHVLFHSAAHGALHLAVFVKRDLIWFCTVPEDDLVQTRAVTMVKTKGAIAVSFQFFGTSFIFINCHFAPGDGKKRERLEDFTKITKNLNLPKQGNVGSPNSSSSDVTTRFDSVFWMGDLNFRIEAYKGKQAVEDIVKYIEQQEHTNFEDLLAGDQLSKLIVEGSIFQGFQEGRINFRPTYKYDIGQDTFDTSSKNRVPSYTDRVLFRAKKKNSIICTHYNSPSNVRLSDHHPVYGIFEVAIQPARDCTLPLAAGQFDRAVYAEANKRRTLKVEVIDAFQKEKSSKVCSIQ